MSNGNKVTITSPVGRFVQGNLYTANDKDATGALRTIKNGPNAGKPNPQYYYAIAIPKNPGEAAWWDTTWGKQILAVGAAAFPQAYQRPDFAWKVTDGDSTALNQQNKRWCDYPNFPGNWILKFTSSFAPNIFTLVGQPPNQPAAVLEKDAVYPGCWIQVQFNVEGNNQPTKPGVYINPNMVCLIYHGERIAFGADPTQAGFGAAGPMPPGASMTPVGNFTPPAAVTAPPAAPATPVAPPAAPATPVAPPPATAVPAVPVAPHTAITTPPAAPAAPATPPAAPAAPAAPGRTMTAKAAGQPYEAFVAQGWTDANLVAHGYMLP